MNICPECHCFLGDAGHAHTCSLRGHAPATFRNSKLEKDFEKLRNALKECLRYVESTAGTRGDLVGCAVNEYEFMGWVRVANGTENRKEGES